MEDTTAAAKPVKKRVRKVSNMSQEQVRAKRDQDREAQRAFRERLKTRIQALEEELAAEKAKHNTELLTDTLASLQRENQELRDQLRRIHDITGSPAGAREREHAASSSANVLASVSQSDQTLSNASPADISQHGISSPQPGQRPLPSEETVSVDPISGNQLRHSPRQTRSSLPISHLLTPQRPPGQDSGSPLLPYPHQMRSPQSSGNHHQRADWLVPRTADAQELESHEKENSPHPSRSSHPSDLGHHMNWQDGVDEDNGMPLESRLDFRRPDNIALADAQESSSESSENSTWANPGAIDRTPRHAILPRHFAPTCPLDQILLNFLSSQRTRAVQGTPFELLLEPRLPSISGLIDPALKSTLRPTSRVMVDVVSTFTDTNLKEQLGFLYIMYSTMRWQVSPSLETFNEMPSWLHPTVMQVMVPHPAWIDNIPWPQVRDLLIQDPVKYSFVKFSEVYARSVSLEWPFDITDAFIPPGQYNTEYLLNPLFVKNVRRLECWSIQELFTARFPELAALMVA
ncbi:hypothetical protein BP6252_05003 [Coleophoma cylindrospora]|uniref:BZIP domain-containing protein n=1 Tax=Coleophoma cylindrospora TaxID=1849047 RepID=A0A3D8RSM0_9HELO|nr:hypothetical protein BP6252_05003 [Coleophoma cylindrospora]